LARRGIYDHVVEGPRWIGVELDNLWAELERFIIRKLKVRSRIVELQAQVATQSITAAALTLDEHLEKLRELRDKADQRGQTNAAIRAEELRGQLKRFYVKQVETGDAGDFSRMSDEELRAYVYGEEFPPKGPEGPVKH
jgi:hypothetical protein